MASNSMHVCFDCRIGNKQGGQCPECKSPMAIFSRRITIPKRNNKRAWKRMQSGEKAWNRRKSRGSRGRDEFSRWDIEIIETEPPELECDHECCRVFHTGKKAVRVPGSERIVANYHRKPDVDLGG